MTALFSASAEADVTVDGCSSQPDGMIWIPGGTFRMGSDKHYPEEAPAHRVTVDGFWMDRYPVTNRQFREFVRATRHVTVAEITPDPKDYPGMLPHMIYAGSLMFSPPDASGQSPGLQPVVDLRQGRELAASLRTRKQHPWAGRSSGRACGLQRCARLRAMGRQGSANRSGMGICGAWRARRTPNLRGAMNSRRPAVTWPTPGRVNSLARTPMPMASSAPRRSAHSRRTATGCTT